MNNDHVFNVEDLIAYATSHSPFYRESIKGRRPPTNLAEMPVIQHKKFWQAYNAGALLTGKLRDGIVFKSGGTTGNPKFSVFSRNEWDTFTRVFGWGICEGGGIKEGDRVANIFYVGELYASFLFIMGALNHAPHRSIHFPIAGSTDIKTIVDTINDFKINVIAGVPTSILTISSYLLENHLSIPSVERILYGGEAMFSDQASVVDQAFPGVTCQSIGWASVDGGLLGYFGTDCLPGEHRIFSGYTIIEIIDEDTGEIIEDEGRPGTVLLTNLTRRLMPIIRYPVGDCGIWTEPAGTLNRKIKLIGRSEEGARVGPATIYFDDIRSALHDFSKQIPVSAFQFVTQHRDGLDELTVKVGVSGKAECFHDAVPALREHIYHQRKMLKDLLDSGFIHPLKVEVVPVHALERNPRTGKLRQLIDLRFQ